MKIEYYVGTALCGRPHLGAHSGAPLRLLMGYGHG